jgi:hypothetical protein
VNKTAAVVGAVAVLATVLTVGMFSGAPRAGASGCAAAIAKAAGDAPGDVAGYSGDQLGNAAAIMNAAAAAHLDPQAQAQVLGVMTAMGESSLHNIDYGDAAGPDSRGLFQQRDSWGTLADRMDPTKAAGLFYDRLVTIDGWQQMIPTLAINAVQRNADPNHYAQYQAAAEQVVAALAGSSTACVPVDVSGSAQQLARALVERLDAGTLVGANGTAAQIRGVADGTAAPGCGVDARILQVLTVAVNTFDQVGISSLNRFCTQTIAGVGTASRHWIAGGGHAVDFYGFDAHATNGADANAVRLIAVLDPLMPEGSAVGQVNCRRSAGTITATTNMLQIDDECNHLHVDVDPTSSQPLAAR